MSGFLKIANLASGLFADRHKRFEEFQALHLELIELFGVDGPALGCVAKDVIANPKAAQEDRSHWGVILSMEDYSFWVKAYADDPTIIMRPASEIKVKIYSGALKSLEGLSRNLGDRERYVELVKEMAAAIRLEQRS